VYTSVEEAARIARSLLNDPGRLKTLSASAREVAKGFSYERFKERMRLLRSWQDVRLRVRSLTVLTVN
jgi:hypothetical protein